MNVHIKLFIITSMSCSPTTLGITCWVAPSSDYPIAMLSSIAGILSNTTMYVAVYCIWKLCPPPQEADTHCSKTCFPQFRLLPQDVSCTGSHTPPSLSWGTTFGIKKCSGPSDLSEMLWQSYVQWGSGNSPKNKEILEQVYWKEKYHKFNKVDVTV